MFGSEVTPRTLGQITQVDSGGDVGHPLRVDEPLFGGVCGPISKVAPGVSGHLS